MASEFITRVMRVYKLHAHIPNVSVRYADFFDWIAGQKGKARVLEIAERVVAVGDVKRASGFVYVRFYEGEKDQLPLIYDIAQNKATPASIPADNVVATKTHVLFDPKRKEAIIEYNHRGAKHTDIASALSALLERFSQNDSAHFSVVPIASSSFLAELDKYKRIRVAELELAEPNFDWEDSAEALADMASQSNAKNISITMTAQRADSLVRKTGFLGIIRDYVAGRKQGMADVKIVGTRKGDDAETHMSLANHVEHRKVKVKRNKAGHVDTPDIWAKMGAYYNARSTRS